MDEAAKKIGRPKKPFDQLSLVTKRQNARKLRNEISINEMGFALEQNFKASGFKDASRLIKNLIENPAIATKYIELSKNQEIAKQYSTDEALALMMDMKLSKRQYKIMYSGAKTRKVRPYPPYHQVVVAKQRCYPAVEFIGISEIGFAIKLQAILDTTAKRLIETLPSSFAEPNRKISLITKWGFDGASNQSQYKQKFENVDGDDASIFLTTLVPIVLRDDQQTYWQNLKTSSTTLCRPIRLSFRRETEAYTREMETEINEEIDDLQPTIVNVEGGSIEIDHKLYCTMIDGKICNHLTNTSSSEVCFICQASPKQMNKLDLIYKRPKCTEFYKYGLSTLHAWLRFMECVLNISCNMSFKKWAKRKQEDKDAAKLKKTQIQNDFRKKTGLKIGFVLQGKGTTNDGNTARKFFRNYKDSAEITGFDIHLLKRFAVILQVISSGKEIDVEKFACYTRETARSYVKLYEWYYMPATVHKILIHGADVIDYAIVPIGQLSEEVQESRHKEVRRFRELNTRKSSRIKTNEDLLHSLLISSDPVVSSFRKIEPSKKLEMFVEAKELLCD